MHRLDHCFEKVDRVPGDNATTAFKREARLRQALWREQHALPIGTEPILPSDARPGRLLCSRIELSHARRTMSNFLSDDVRRAVCHRLSYQEPHQTLKKDRLLADLLSSMPLCFNLFRAVSHGAIAEAAIGVVKPLWPSAPGDISWVKFEWSPGRCLPGEYLENRSAFDVAFGTSIPGEGTAVLGVETKYHEHVRKEATPKPHRLARYRHVADQSGVFKPGAIDSLLGSPLQQIWLDHLLLLSMLQKPTTWRAGKFVLLYPSRNVSFERAAKDYGDLLTNDATFEGRTIESLLSTVTLPDAAAFSSRYLW